MSEARASDGKYRVEIRDACGVVIGDNNVVYQYFLDERYRLLAEHLIIFDDLIAERTADFVGRAFLDARLAAFMEQHDRGYYILVGEPGIGKTAWAAHVVREYQALHHFNVSAMGIVRPDQALENLCAQIIARFQLDQPYLPVNAGRDGSLLDKLLHQAAERLDGSKLVIVIDALDEAQMPADVRGTNAIYLPSSLPLGVYFVLTRRPQPVLLETAPGTSLEAFTLGADLPANQADVRVYLRQQSTGTEIAARLADRHIPTERFIEELAERSAGNFMYLAYLLPDIAAGLFDPLNLTGLPQGLRGYYERFWNELESAKGEGREAWAKFYKPVIGMLAAAHEPVSAAWIGRILGLDPDEVTDFTLARWRKFLHRADAAGEGCWRLYHASFADFVLERLGGATEYHGRIARYYIDYSERWTEEGSYALRHLASHLTGVDNNTVYRLAESPTWLAAQQAHEPSLRNYVPTVEAAIDRARRAGVDGLPVLVSYNLWLASIGSLANAYSPGILAATIHLARGTPSSARTARSAVGYAALIIEPRRKLQSCLGVVAALKTEHPELAYQALEQAVDAFSMLSPDAYPMMDLPDVGMALIAAGSRNGLSHLLQSAGSLADFSSWQNKLYDLAGIAARSGALDALEDIAAALGRHHQHGELIFYRARFARELALAGHLAEGWRLLRPALSGVEAISSASGQADALVSLAEACQALGQDDVVPGLKRSALTLVSTLPSGSDRARILLKLRAITQGDVRRHLLDEAVATILSLGRLDSLFDVEMLSKALLEENATEHLDALVAFACRGPDTEHLYQEEWLVGLAPAFTCMHGLASALRLITAIEDGGPGRLRLLGGIASGLPELPTRSDLSRLLDEVEQLDVDFIYLVDVAQALSPRIVCAQDQNALQRLFRLALRFREPLPHYLDSLWDAVWAALWPLLGPLPVDRLQALVEQVPTARPDQSDLRGLFFRLSALARLAAVLAGVGQSHLVPDLVPLIDRGNESGTAQHCALILIEKGCLDDARRLLEMPPPRERGRVGQSQALAALAHGAAACGRHDLLKWIAGQSLLPTTQERVAARWEWRSGDTVDPELLDEIAPLLAEAGLRQEAEEVVTACVVAQRHDHVRFGHEGRGALLDALAQGGDIQLALSLVQQLPLLERDLAEARLGYWLVQETDRRQRDRALRRASDSRDLYLRPLALEHAARGALQCGDFVLMQALLKKLHDCLPLLLNGNSRGRPHDRAVQIVLRLIRDLTDAGQYNRAAGFLHHLTMMDGGDQAWRTILESAITSDDAEAVAALGRSPLPEDRRFQLMERLLQAGKTEAARRMARATISGLIPEDRDLPEAAYSAYGRPKRYVEGERNRRLADVCEILALAGDWQQACACATYIRDAGRRVDIRLAAVRQGLRGAAYVHPARLQALGEVLRAAETDVLADLAQERGRKSRHERLADLAELYLKCDDCGTAAAAIGRLRNEASVHEGAKQEFYKQVEPVPALCRCLAPAAALGLTEEVWGSIDRLLQPPDQRGSFSANPDTLAVAFGAALRAATLQEDPARISRFLALSEQLSDSNHLRALLSVLRGLLSAGQMAQATSVAERAEAVCRAAHGSFSRAHDYLELAHVVSDWPEQAHRLVPVIVAAAKDLADEPVRSLQFKEHSRSQTLLRIAGWLRQIGDRKAALAVLVLLMDVIETFRVDYYDDSAWPVLLQELREAGDGTALLRALRLTECLRSYERNAMLPKTVAAVLPYVGQQPTATAQALAGLFESRRHRGRDEVWALISASAPLFLRLGGTQTVNATWMRLAAIEALYSPPELPKERGGSTRMQQLRHDVMDRISGMPYTNNYEHLS